MKYNKRSLYLSYPAVLFCLSFFAVVFFAGCGGDPKITRSEYKHEKTVFGNHRLAFDIQLENIGNSGRIYNLINSLIYDSGNFDEYIEYREKDFTGKISEDDSPPALNDDGTEYIYNSELIEKYSIIFNNSQYIVFEYDSYIYYGGAAHGNSLIGYFIIDVKEERILDINDLMYPIPDDLLKGIIEADYDASHYFRENIWPPDTVNFCDKDIELIWNAYSITPYSYGTIRIKIQDEIIGQYLTDKGKALKKTIHG